MSLCGHVYVEDGWRDDDDPCTAQRGHDGRHEGRLGARWSDAEGDYPDAAPTASLALDYERGMAAGRLEERRRIAMYFARRAEWLTYEVNHGGHPSLGMDAARERDRIETIADLERWDDGFIGETPERLAAATARVDKAFAEAADARRRRAEKAGAR